MNGPRVQVFRHAGGELAFDPDRLSVALVRGERRAVPLPSPGGDGSCTRWAAIGTRGASVGDAPKTRSTAREGGAPRELDRLTVCVSNTCNMACRYCYAERGKYGAAAGLMSRETALVTAAWAMRTFHSIHHLHFFGGEPTLNLEAIHLLCEFFEYCADRGRIARPTFGITTNALDLSARALEMFRRFGFTVTVSVDGPPEVHDTTRPDPHGLPTHHAIARSVSGLCAAGIVPEFECTYTAEHIRRGIRVVDLLRYFAERFDCRVLHVPLVIARPRSAWHVSLAEAAPIYVEAVRESIRSMSAGRPRCISVVARWIQSLERQHPIASYCPAGTSSLTVHADGSIATCFVLSRDNRSRVGHISERIAPQRIVDVANAAVAPYDKWRHPACQRCWLQPLCFGCIGDDLEREEGLPVWAHTGGLAPGCDLRRSLAAAFFETLGAVSCQESSVPPPRDQS